MDYSLPAAEETVDEVLVARWLDDLFLSNQFKKKIMKNVSRLFLRCTAPSFQ